jgi:hypothetical protein
MTTGRATEDWLTSTGLTKANQNKFDAVRYDTSLCYGGPDGTFKYSQNGEVNYV